MGAIVTHNYFSIHISSSAIKALITGFIPFTEVHTINLGYTVEVYSSAQLVLWVEYHKLGPSPFRPYSTLIQHCSKDSLTHFFPKCSVMTTFSGKINTILFLSVATFLFMVVVVWSSYMLQAHTHFRTLLHMYLYSDIGSKWHRHFSSCCIIFYWTSNILIIKSSNLACLWSLQTL